MHQIKTTSYRGIQRRPDAYVVRLFNWETRVETTKRFTFSMYSVGEQAALKAAISYRRKWMKRPAFRPRQRQQPRTFSGVNLVHGVYLLVQEKGRKIFWQSLKPGLPTRSFSVRVYGWEDAYRLAVEATSNMIANHRKPKFIVPPLPENIVKLLNKRWKRKKRKDAKKRRRRQPAK